LGGLNTLLPGWMVVSAQPGGNLFNLLNPFNPLNRLIHS
jgi:hypothetical protein